MDLSGCLIYREIRCIIIVLFAVTAGAVSIYKSLCSIAVRSYLSAEVKLVGGKFFEMFEQFVFET